MSVLTVFALKAYTTSVFATDEPAEPRQINMQISPAYQRLGELTPGDRYSSKFTIINSGDSDLEYKVYTTGYTVSDGDYKASFPENTSTFTTIQKWFKFSETEGTLKAKDRKEIEYTVTVPKDAPGGGQYAAIMIETTSGEGSVISANARAGLVVYSTVLGDNVSCNEISNISASGFLMSPPISVATTIKNCGNIESSATYTLTVNSIFGKEVYSNSAEPDVRTILPNTSRLNIVKWEETPIFGIYKVRLKVEVPGEVKEFEKLVFICPIWVFIIVILLIGFIVFMIIVRKRKHVRVIE
ncbi:MAG: hypothetical protein Q4E47_00595 [Candidatus Saccharibacteria bacterium]|nr:hypothetical protein [Candidatus Saccharibacteria bacterium]